MTEVVGRKRTSTRRHRDTQRSRQADLRGLAVRCGPGHSRLDAAAVIDLLATDHDGRVPDAVKLRSDRICRLSGCDVM